MNESVKLITVVEDDPDTIEICRALFSDTADWEVNFATDAERALQMIRQKKPDLLLLDIILNGKSGFDLLVEIRKDEGLKDLKVVVFSNLSRQEDAEKALELGALDFLQKSTFLNGSARNKIREYL